ncbi:MAG: DNA translocase FtsK [Spirochaetes bacterium]|nr:DNA translocase FtsK [Spirochaetota bacterium]
MVQRVSHAVVAGSVFGVGVLILTSLFAHVLPIGEGFWGALIAVPGRILFESFHAAAFLIPLFFFGFGVTAARGDTRVRSLSVINLLVLPFLSFSLSLRLAFNANIEASPITRWAAAVFSQPGGALLFLAMGAVLAVGVVRVARHGLAGFRVSPQESSRGSAESASGADGGVGWGESKRKIMALIEDRSGDRGARDAGDVDAPGDAAWERVRPRWVSGFTEEPEVSMGYADVDPGETEVEQDVEQGGEEPTEVLDAEELEALGRRDRGWGAEWDEDIVVVEPVGEEIARQTDEQIGEDADEDELEVIYADGGFADPGDDYDPAAEYALGEAISGGEPASRVPAATPTRRHGRYEVPVDGLLDEYHQAGYWEIDDETRESAEVLRYTLEEFSIQAEVTGIRKGPVITMFEILPAPGVKLARITNLADNIALRLAASSVRIVAPIPGKHAVGIEIPNKKRHIVSFMELIRQDGFWSSKQAIPLALGKDIPGDVEIVDLTKTPHLLIAGATGSGKSVCVNSIICSILYRRSPQEVKMMLIDPKIVELKFYNDIPHLLTPVITDPKRAFQALQYCIYEMERRYNLLDSLGVRDISAYNEKIQKRNLATEPLPYIVVVVDELADLMTTSGKELESTLARLAAMSRAVGIHLVLATQRPSTDVITGLIKANIPSRIAFMVSSKVDSRIIIDAGGAEKLLGQGDMLFTSAWDPFPTRMQGAFLSDAEVERVVEHVKTLGEPEYIDDEIFVDDEDDETMQGELEDPLMEKAIDIVVSANKASASYLQRRLKIGYNRAARLVEEMERIGVVGPQRGSKPRDIIGAPEAH